MKNTIGMLAALVLVAGAIFVASSHEDPARAVAKVQTLVGHGTGWAVSRRHVVTNKHVVATFKTVTVRFGKKVHKGRVVYVSKTLDLAVILIDKAPSVLPIDCRYRHTPGHQVRVIGYPLRLGFHLTRGWITGLYRGNLMFTAPILPGSSGSPVLRHGRVVGVVFAGIGLQSQMGAFIPYGFNIAIPAWKVCAELRRIKILPEDRPHG